MYKFAFVIALAAVIAGVYQCIVGYPAPSWLMYWVITIIAFINIGLDFWAHESLKKYDEMRKKLSADPEMEKFYQEMLDSFEKKITETKYKNDEKED